MSRIVVVGLRPHHVIVPNWMLNTWPTPDMTTVLVFSNKFNFFAKLNTDRWNTGVPVIEFTLTSVLLLKRLIKHGALFWCNQLRNQANACTILSSLWNPQCHGSEKTLRKNLTATPFSYINDASVYLNEVCLHITYLFLKELVFVIAVFLLALLSHENLDFFPGSGIKSLFTGIDSSTELIYSSMSFFFYLFSYFIVIANVVFSNRSLGTFFRGFCIPFPFPDSGFRIPCFSAALQNMADSKFTFYRLLPLLRWVRTIATWKTVI